MYNNQEKGFLQGGLSTVHVLEVWPLARQCWETVETLKIQNLVVCLCSKAPGTERWFL